uniref:NADH-ubiquinone oxidoreductase chain 5 n=1 Tax=Sirodotia delicatula TaxID=386631 RepID=A0A343UY32_9FLOR|nr:NADH dehydrogenase subunit 5 [Sirodotia delicatula]AVK39589.1 NADH dehydrogenase subunit 5 [Sirodotia delicatula]
MYLMIIVVPLLGALFTGFTGRWLGNYGATMFSTSCVLFTFLVSLLAFYEVGISGISCYITLFTWIESGTFKVSWSFLFDSLTVVMLVIITSISSLVHLYSVKYMEEDPHVPRFMAYLGIFTFFMIILVTANNLVQLFLGWEGVGLASYLLINFWYTRLSANQAAIKALVVNRIGDIGLSLGILTLFYIFHSVEYSVIFACAPLVTNYYFYVFSFQIHGLSLVGIFLFIGALGKSAQLGLHTWLPDAMEGPTPVSALIHAATMVTAGVFLMVRFSPLLEYSSFTLFILTIFGSMTAFFAAVTGAFQNDLKKVIAYSTCSQLGYMIFACGLSNYHVSMFHLSNHAFFKALLFLSAGSVIHAVSDEQDMRRLGSLVNLLPLTYSLMLIGSLALAGFPFLSGFYSKDFIIELSQITGYSNLNVSYGFFACWLGATSVFFTSFYSARLIYLTFLNNSNVPRPTLSFVHEPSWLMTLPLMVLAFGSIFIGYLTKDLFVGLGSDFWGSSIFIFPYKAYSLEAEWLTTSIKWLPFFISISGIICASLLNILDLTFYSNFQYNKFLAVLAFLSNKKWYWDKIYNDLFVRSLMRFGYQISFKNIDRGFLELTGPWGLSTLTSLFSIRSTAAQTGQLNHYIFFIVIGFTIIFSLFLPNLLFAFKLDSYVLGIFCILFLFI